MMVGSTHHAKAELMGLHFAPHWSGKDEFDALVKRNAAAAGLDLSDDHWNAIRWVVNVYGEHDETPPLRLLSATLEKRFASSGGRKWLYQLFPGGPVREICQLAELPLPSGVSDDSFGYSF